MEQCRLLVLTRACGFPPAFSGCVPAAFRLRSGCVCSRGRVADKTDSPEKWVQAKWEELIVKFLVKTIEDVNDDEWTVGLCEEMTKQFPLYQGAPLLKVRTDP